MIKLTPNWENPMAMMLLIVLGFLGLANIVFIFLMWLGKYKGA